MVTRRFLPLRRLRATTVLLALAAVVALPAVASAAPTRDPDLIPGQYIVVYKNSVQLPGAATTRREAREGFRAQQRYSHALKGFSAKLDGAQVAALESDPNVAAVVQDRRVHASALPLAGEKVPTGVARTGATGRGAASVNVAVIDSGVQLSNPDLNVVDGKNCVTPANSANDDYGHGTHVAGTIGALNNGSGVIGVAPGTKIYAVKVLGSTGSGSWSQVACGIDWVTSNASALNIKVASMSLGGTGAPVKACATDTDPLHAAICRSTAAGVTYVVAAGNSGWDFDYASAPDVPAAYPEVLTVTAASDSDGLAGALGSAPSCTTGQSDDRYASFSNYAKTTAGQAHTIAAPGVCILSTWLNNTTNTISGTSMATPHISAQVALCFGEGAVTGPCNGKTPAEVIAAMTTAAQSYNAVATNFGFSGDPLHSPVSGRYYGYLANASGLAPTAPPPLAPVDRSPASYTRVSGTLRSGTLSNLNLDDSLYLSLNSTTSSTRTVQWYGTFSGVPSSPTAITATYKGNASAACTQVFAIYNWSTATWVTLDTRAIGATDVLVSLSVTGTLRNFVSSGNARLRVTCTSKTGSFFTNANLLRLTTTG
ncbi:unannotated protein [freshwater metagenome]|uniref:Unannotated protein n=1 Tax=freshwater metagenome TaxID=449393 RepID=A0A6J7CSD6_9ZZZZ|nr:S8 family serine peptidase [Actinomycetota bacterium]